MSTPVFPVGAVIDWNSGVRSVIEDHFPITDNYLIRDVGSTHTWSCNETKLASSAVKAQIQPGQVFQALQYRYKVLAPETSFKWLVESIPMKSKHVVSDWTLLTDWTLVDPVSLGGVPVLRHGHSKCPRCGCDGALVLFNVTVECVNKSCIKYKPLF